MKTVFFLNRLRDGVSPEDYEAWVRSVDYPTAASIPSIQEYRVWRVEGMLEGDDTPPYQYIERVIITDLDTYRKDLQAPRLEDFGKQWSSYVGESIAVQGTMIE